MNRSRVNAAFAAGMLVASMALAACGSGEAGAESNGPVDEAGLAEARELVKEFTAVPTVIPVDVPLSAEPEAGSVVYIGPGLPSSNKISEAINEAADRMGWAFKNVNYKLGDAASLQGALSVALQSKPTVVIEAGVAPDNIAKSVLESYAEAGVPLIFNSAVPVENSEYLLGPVGGFEQSSLVGRMLGAWFVAESEGKGHALFSSLPAFPLFAQIAKSFEETVEELCPDACSVTKVEFTAQQLASGAIASGIAAKLRADPKIKYVVVDSGGFVPGLNSALSAAGLRDIKIAGNDGQPDNMAELKKGTQHAWVPVDSHYSGYCAFDMALRASLGEVDNLLCDPLIPVLFTPETVGEPSSDYQAIADELDQFEKLWKP